jgi:hypothetical protein
MKYSNSQLPVKMLGSVAPTCFFSVPYYLPQHQILILERLLHVLNPTCSHCIKYICCPTKRGLSEITDISNKVLKAMGNKTPTLLDDLLLNKINAFSSFLIQW